MDFDSMLVELGEWGAYQQLTMWLLCVPGCIMNSFNGFVLVFLIFSPDHKCKIPSANQSLQSLQSLNMSWNTDNVLITAGQCHLQYLNLATNDSVEIGCHEWDYDTEYFDSTLITKFDLVCDKAIQAKTMLSVISGVTVFGCILYSYISDRWGRKVAFEINVFTYIFGATVSLMMPNLIAFTAVRLISAVNGISTFNICYIWALEYTGPSHRTRVTTIMCVIYALGGASLSLIGYFCRTWVQMGLATSIPFVLLFSYHFIVMESPRWLLSKGRYAEVERILGKVLAFNRRFQKGKQHSKQSLHEIMVLLKENEQKERRKAEESAAGVRNPQLSDLFRTPNLRLKTILITFVFIACAVLYVTIAYNTENLEANFYLTWALQAFVEAPATVVNLIVLNRYGRIWPLAGSSILAGILCLLTVPAEYIAKWLVVALAILGKFGICMAYAIIYQLGGELFPTVVRGLGIGFGSVVGDVGNITMPYIIYSARTFKFLPMIIMGFIAIFGGVASLFLPETLGRHLPQTLEDGETVGVVSWETFWGHFKALGAHRLTPADSSTEETPENEPLSVTYQNGHTTDATINVDNL